MTKNTIDSISKELFLDWRSPRYGKSNPEKMNNPVWEWLIKNKLNAYQANKKFEGPSSRNAGPCWCFDRFGQTTTLLNDGRKVLIAGEHEDSYDPDFYIYNDIVIINKDKSIDIYGYPKETFPPTDFHSATLINDQIIIIGNLGYSENRNPETTQVYQVNTNDFSISPIQTTGDKPGWIYSHNAKISKDKKYIKITKGKIYRDDKRIVENIDDWKLSLENWNWTRITPVRNS